MPAVLFHGLWLGGSRTEKASYYGRLRSVRRRSEGQEVSGRLQVRRREVRQKMILQPDQRAGY